jgi:hypothetical protein
MDKVYERFKELVGFFTGLLFHSETAVSHGCYREFSDTSYRGEKLEVNF